MAHRREHIRFLAKETLTPLRVQVAAVADDLILAESSRNTVDLRNTAR